VCSARQSKLERVRWIDSTVTAGADARATDSSLLWDAVRVMVRLLKQASACLARPRSSGAITAGWPRSAPSLSNTAGAKAQKAKLYREIIAATRATVSTLRHACSVWPQAPRSKPSSGSAKSRHYLPLIERIITQAERRVLAGERCRAARQAVSPVRDGTPISSSRVVARCTLRSQAEPDHRQDGLILDVVARPEPGRCRALPSHARAHIAPPGYATAKRPVMVATPASTI